MKLRGTMGKVCPLFCDRDLVRWFSRVGAGLALAVLAGTFAVPSSHAATTIDVGTHGLLPHTPGQTIQLIAVPGETSDSVTGFNLRAQLGDGLSPNPEPVFSSVDFVSGTFWNSPVTIIGGPVVAAPQFAQASVVFDESGVQRSADGLIVTLTVDTRGLLSGSFPLKLESTAIGFPSVFIAQGGADITPQIVNGTVDILPALCGNLDLDNDVDSLDLQMFIANWTGFLEPGTGNAVFLDGDCDADGDVDSADLTALIGAWTGFQEAGPAAAPVVLPSVSHTLTQPASAAQAARTVAVPEPAAALMILTGLTLAILRHRSRR